MVAQMGAHLRKRLLAASRKGENGVALYLFRLSRRVGRLLQNDVNVCSAYAESADTRPSWRLSPWPLGCRRRNVEGTFLKTDAGIELLLTGHPRHLPAARGQARLGLAGPAASLGSARLCFPLPRCACSIR